VEGYVGNIGNVEGFLVLQKKEMVHGESNTNDELDELIRHKNIINRIKAQRLSWFGQMSEERMVQRVYKWKQMLTRPLGRPKNRWEDYIINDNEQTENKELD
jgi:hypothetical protein